MSIRQALGGDAERLHAVLDELLDSEDAVLVLFDGRRAVNYVNGFGLSPCQLELMAVEIERTVRTAGAGPASGARGSRTRRRRVRPGNVNAVIGKETQ